MACSTTRVVKMGIDYGEVQLLSTAGIAPHNAAMLQDKNIRLETIEMTAAVPLVNNYLVQLVHQRAALPLLAVFTSPDAVRAVANILNGQAVPWQIATLDKTTHYAVQDAFPDNDRLLVAPAEAELVQGLEQAAVPDGGIVYYCGNKYSDRVPALCREKGISLEEVMVYQVLIKAAPVTGYYNGILFLNESAVDSFFVFNEFPNNTVAFCLTERIAAVLSSRLSQPAVIVQAAEPTEASLLESVLAYYDRIG